MNLSVPINDTMEYLNATEISPLISHALVKVCYVGQQPNRNSTVITKEVATEMGKKLPGSPVVGFYNKKDKDFESHNKELIIQDGKLEILDTTRPYGFVPTNAKVWFQKFSDNGVEHEYLCTECYIWTGAYPESKRVIEKGNNQSMEISRQNEKGFWTNDSNSGKRIFIYNEALIEKLCLLGENVEPCFEGSQVKSQFSLEMPGFEEFKTQMFSMMTQIQETLNKGGSHMEENKDLELEKQDPAPAEEFKKNPEEEEKNPPKDESGNEPEKKEEPEDEDKKKKKDDEDYACGGAGGEDDKKKKYNLEEVTEYAELKTQYDELQTKYSALETEKAALDSELTTLREFKSATDRKEKQAMIDSFYMLGEEDKKDCVEHIDTYSVDDIEAKLSIICVRNKVNFNLEEEQSKEDNNDSKPQGLFNLNNLPEDDKAPAWIKAVRQTAANK